MRPTHGLLARTPMIKFLGKRIPPKTITPAAPANEPAPHPASPSHSLPDSFMAYRSKAQQHGPLAGHGRSGQSASSSSSSASSSRTSSPTPSSSSSFLSSSSSSSAPPSPSPIYGAVGGVSGHALGNVEPDRGKGEVWDRSELPGRFGRLRWEEEEIEAVGLGGANLPVGWGGS